MIEFTVDNQKRVIILRNTEIEQRVYMDAWFYVDIYEGYKPYVADNNYGYIIKLAPKWTGVVPLLIGNIDNFINYAHHINHPRVKFIKDYERRELK